MKLRESNEQNNISDKKQTVAWRDPVLLGFILLAIMGVVGTSVESGDYRSSVLFVAGVILAGFLVLFLSRKQSQATINISGPRYGYWIFLSYFVLFMLFSVFTRGEGILSNEFGKWVWFVIIPALLLLIIHRRTKNIKAILGSIGFARQGSGRALLLGFLAYLVFIPLLVFIMPESQIQRLQEIFQEPVKALILLLISLIFSLVTAASTEEFFFRGILQSRLTSRIGSELRSCLITAFLFGIYHLPYAYFSASWPTHGNLVWAVSSVLAEQMITGVLLGTLWFRTRNILAPVLLHTLINTPALMSMLNLNIG